jgi:Nif-specific ferredoxin III
MSFVKGKLANGEEWQPAFIQAIDKDDCIGCGRCLKICPRDVMEMIGLDEDGEEVDAFDEEAERKVMVLKDAGDCIGCQACAKGCPKNCQTHEPLAA